MHSLQRGKRASGDLIPWTVSQQVCTGRWGGEGSFTLESCCRDVLWPVLVLRTGVCLGLIGVGRSKIKLNFREK